LNGVIVFVKNPELGKVKTRLAQTLGDQQALDIYHQLVAYTRNMLLELEGVKRIVYYSSFIDENDEWYPTHFAKRLQVQEDLGTRIMSAVREVFAECSKVVIIGSDCPQLTSDHIQKAFDLLATHHLVLGPSLDGGYYLLGLDSYEPDLFQEITWSTDVVARQTLEKAEAKGLTSCKLEPLSDIDHEEDWINHGFK